MSTSDANAPEHDKIAHNFATFLLILQLVREAQTPESLAYIAVNETKRLVDYQRAAMLKRLPNGRYDVVAISGVSQFDRNSSYCDFLRRLCKSQPEASHVAGQSIKVVNPIDSATLPDDLQAELPKWQSQHMLCCRMLDKNHHTVGMLILCRSKKPFSTNEQTLIASLVSSFNYGWTIMAKRTLQDWLAIMGSVKRRWWVLVVIALLCLPIRQTILAPAEIVPSKPVQISAPMEGVIREILVTPSDDVTEGQPLFRYDDLSVKSDYDAAKRALEVAQAELRQSQQGAFMDAEARARVAILRAEINKHQVEMDYAKSRLERVTVTAPSSGVVVFSDVVDWLGKPVVTGERVMLVGNPNQVAISMHIPIAEAISVERDARVNMYADISPLTPISGTLDYISYESEQSKHGFLAYASRASINDGEEMPRIGLHGTAKVYGGYVPLGYYLVRRPLAFLRRLTGI